MRMGIDGKLGLQDYYTVDFAVAETVADLLSRTCGRGQRSRSWATVVLMGSGRGG